jgi:copper resistance protein D
MRYDRHEARVLTVLIDIIVLWMHLFAAIIFIGGSFFIWLVVWPASYGLATNETQRSIIVGRIAKRFAYFTHVSIAVLVASGTYLALPFLQSPSSLSTTLSGELLLAKVLVVVSMIILMYANNIYHGKKIMRLVAQGELDDVRRVRKLTHLASFITLGLMTIITVLGVALLFY